MLKRIKNDKFKTNEIAGFLTLPLNKETIMKNALIPSILRRGSANYKNQTEISKKLEEMYGAFFNCGIDKSGNYCVLKFYMETICDKFTPNKEDICKASFDLLMDIIFNPLVVDGGFDKDYLDQEKDNLKKVIESRKDNKASYAYSRCIEEMFKGDPYGIYKYGKVDELDEIDAKSLYEYYKQVVKNAKIDIFINGEDADELDVEGVIKKIGSTKCGEKAENTSAESCKSEDDASNNNCAPNNDWLLNKVNSNEELKVSKETKVQPEEGKVVTEKADVVQGKLVIGLTAPESNKYATTMYNAILGGGANSKLFQNVREKASLAYSAGSRFIRRKNAIFIITGIELQNYDKALEIIKKQISDMAEGNFTDKELNEARELVKASLRLLKESQEDMIAFDFDQQLFGENLTVDTYMSKIEAVSRADIINVAQQIKINTIYYLEK